MVHDMLHCSPCSFSGRLVVQVVWVWHGVGWGVVAMTVVRQTLSQLIKYSQLTSDLLLPTVLLLGISETTFFPLLLARMCGRPPLPGERRGTFTHCLCNNLPLPPSNSGSVQEHFNVRAYVLLPQQLMDTGSLCCLT